MIYSKNFCSYLEAFKSLKLDCKECSKICKNVLEKPVQKLIDVYLNEIKSNNKIEFSRDYDCLRYPGSSLDHCLEYLELANNSE